MQRSVVLKFGGTSVSSADNWNTIANVLKKRLAEGHTPFVVCSALSGVTNKLESLLDTSLQGEHEPVLHDLYERHRQLADDLGVQAEETLSAPFEKLRRLAHGISLVEIVSPPVHARVLAAGEIMSTKLGAAYLQKEGLDALWHDATTLLEAKSNPHASSSRRYLSAQCDYSVDYHLQEEMAAKDVDVHISQGFVAGNSDGETVLLGRGGSDTSAAYLAAKLQADRLEVWTDVPGLFTCNPRLIPSARLLRRLGYDEAQELATMGASVLHPRCIAPVQRYGIPLHVHATNAPNVEGTVISNEAADAGAQVKAISAKDGVRLISMQTLGMWQQVGFLADVFGVFKRHGLSIDLVATSETDVTVSLDPNANILNPTVMESVLAELGSYCDARQIGPCAVVSLVGRNLRSILPELGPALEVFDQQQVHLITQASSDLNLSFVIEEEQTERVLGRLHDKLFSTQPENEVFGPSWHALFDAPARVAVHRWWRKHREELIDIAQESAPCYVYDEHTLAAAADAVTGLEPVDRVFYSVKANSNADVLRALERRGVGFECVSPEELDHVRAVIPELSTERLLFTPNFAPRYEYEQGIQAGAFVTLDNLYPLESWPDTFEGVDLLVRIDPGEGRGHHRHVRTAGSQSKFGVAPRNLDRLSAAAEQAGARIVGLHAHVGSGIVEPRTWGQIASTLAAHAKRFPDVRFLNVGGGLGVAERPDVRSLDLDAVEKHLNTFKENHPDVELWMEPGRFLVAEAGVLLARVTQTKRKGAEVQYLGLETGMNSLIRPALYGSYHEIINLTRIDDQDAVTADVVGPICESGDILGRNRRLPPTHEGDVLLIATAGAYGHTMRSNYNMRTPASEVFLAEMPVLTS